MKSRTGHGVELKFGMNAYISIGMAGFFALLPLTAGAAPVAGLFGGFDPGAGSSWPILSAIAAPLTAFSIVIAPWLVPCLVLRARQPKGAHIDWDRDEIVEWDGPWKRTVIRWEHAEAARLTWIDESARHRWKRTAIQVFDKTNPASVITAWDDAPEGALVVRRRLEVAKIGPLDSAVESHSGFTRQFEIERTLDPDRIAQTTLVRWVTRIGYVGGFFGPLIAGENPLAGIAISIPAAALLAWRAAPVFRELARLLGRLFRPAVRSMPAHADPYRAMPAEEPAASDPNGLVALRYRLRAVFAEASVRALFAILPLVGAVSSLLTDFK